MSDPSDCSTIANLDNLVVPITNRSAFPSRPVPQSHGSIFKNQAIAQSDQPPSTIAYGQTVVHVPKQYDVLFGRGKPFQEHPGNVRMHRIIMEYSER